MQASAGLTSGELHRAGSRLLRNQYSNPVPAPTTLWPWSTHLVKHDARLRDLLELGLGAAKVHGATHGAHAAALLGGGSSGAASADSCGVSEQVGAGGPAPGPMPPHSCRVGVPEAWLISDLATASPPACSTTGTHASIGTQPAPSTSPSSILSSTHPPSSSPSRRRRGGRAGTGRQRR